MDYDDWDPSVLVLYEYDKEGMEGKDLWTWEYCDSEYNIVLTALHLFDYETCCKDLDEAYEAAVNAKVRKIGEADTLKRKRRIEVYPHGDYFRFRLIDKNDVVRAICVRDYSFQRAWRTAEYISENIRKSRFHRMGYDWHEDHPRIDTFREEYLKNGE